MIHLRQSTASQEVPLGYFVDSTDGNSEEVALTINATDIKIWKSGATTLANKTSGGATHISNGIYYAVLDATDTDTIGPLVIFVHVAGALAIKVNCVVLDEAVYDVMFGTVAPATATNITGGTITTATNVTTVNGLAAGVITAAVIATGAIDADAIASDAITAAKIADGAIDAAAFAAGAITAATIAADAIGASELAADAVTEIAAAIVIPSAATIADAVWDEDATAHQTGGTFGQAIGDPVADTNTIYGAVVTGATGATIAADIVDIEGKVDDLETRMGTPSDLGGGATVAANLADIEAQTDDIAGLSIPTAAAVADAVWDEATLGHTTAGTFGEQVKTDIDAILVDTGTTLQAELDGIQADTEDIQARLPAALVSGRMDANVGAMAANTLTASALATDAVTEIQTGLGAGLDAAGVRAAVGLATANLDTQLGDLPTNSELATALAAADDAVLAAIAALNNLSQANIRTALGLASANLDTQLADLPTNAELSTALAAADDAILTAIAALNNISAAQVNAEVVDALTVDVITDSTPALGSRPTIAQAALAGYRFNNGRLTVAGVTSVLKEDMDTEAYELTLNDADDPSGVERTA